MDNLYETPANDDPWKTTLGQEEEKKKQQSLDGRFVILDVPDTMEKQSAKKKKTKRKRSDDGDDKSTEKPAIKRRKMRKSKHKKAVDSGTDETPDDGKAAKKEEKGKMRPHAAFRHAIQSIWNEHKNSLQGVTMTEINQAMELLCGETIGVAAVQARILIERRKQAQRQLSSSSGGGGTGKKRPTHDIPELTEYWIVSIKGEYTMCPYDQDQCLGDACVTSIDQNTLAGKRGRRVEKGSVKYKPDCAHSFCRICCEAYQVAQGGTKPCARHR